MKRNPDTAAAVDERLSQAMVAANYRVTLNNQKQLARLKLEKNLTFSINGGIFKVTPELVSFVGVLLAQGQEEAILLDVNKNPIEIEKLEEFRDMIVEKYHEGMNEFLVEFKSLQKKRTTGSLVE